MYKNYLLILRINGREELYYFDEVSDAVDWFKVNYKSFKSDGVEIKSFYRIENNIENLFHALGGNSESSWKWARY
jgi:hypothetical protein